MNQQSYRFVLFDFLYFLLYFVNFAPLTHAVALPQTHLEAASPSRIPDRPTSLTGLAHVFPSFLAICLFCYFVVLDAPARGGALRVAVEPQARRVRGCEDQPAARSSEDGTVQPRYAGELMNMKNGGALPSLRACCKRYGMSPFA